MGKRRKASEAAAASGPRAVDPSDARLGPIRSYKGVADQQDEFLMGQDRIMFDDSDDGDGDGPHAKRQRKEEEEEEELELSDEEVLGYDDPDDEYDYIPQKDRKAKSKKKKGADGDDDDDMEEAEGADQGWWGASRGEYYDADGIETEADALEEEVEARRLQKKKLARMAEEDFAFDEAEWAAAPGPADGEDGEDGGAGATVTEVLEDAEVPADMTPEERYKLLQAQYPEFDHLVQEFNSVQPLVDGLRRDADAAGRPGTTVEAVKYWVLGCYVAALGSYFAILTSPARDTKGQTTTIKALSAADLRDHEIMATLVRCRRAWIKVRDLQGKHAANVVAEPDAPVDALYVGTGLGKPEQEEESKEKEKKTKATEEEAVSKPKEKARAKAAREAKAARVARAAAAAETAVADLYNLSHGRRSAKARHGAPDNMPDFGEEDALDSHTAAQKAARKKSLRFYTSQIVQKASKRARAGRDAGGDMDIPYRQSLREREEKTRQAKAKARDRDRASGGGGGGGGGEGDGGKGDGGSEWVDENDVSSDKTRAADSDAEYYDMVVSAARKNKADKKAYNEAVALAGALDRVVEVEDVGEDGKRKVSYAIQKNKGLAPKRKKEVRNPRVKYRNKMAKAMKKLVSRRGTLHKEEGRHGYDGEKTGINMRVIKSVKL